jgi:hypothetical protein
MNIVFQEGRSYWIVNDKNLVTYLLFLYVTITTLSVGISLIKRDTKKNKTFRKSMIKWVRLQFSKTAEVEEAISKHTQ